jgi:hypothetical protein
MLNKEYWLNKKVISLSNGFQTNPADPCIMIGTVVDFFEQLPIVKMDEDGQEYTCFSTILEYEDDLYNILMKLSAPERYELIMAIVSRCNVRE